jgi:hypothetical protein
MNISKLHQQYWFHDGQIKSFHLDIQTGTIEIELLIKRKTKEQGGISEQGGINEKNLIPCDLKLTFRQLIEVSIFDKFPTDGYYLEFVTFNGGGSEVALFITLFDNSSYGYDKPNWVVKSKRVSWEEV